MSNDDNSNDTPQQDTEQSETEKPVFIPQPERRDLNNLDKLIQKTVLQPKQAALKKTTLLSQKQKTDMTNQ